MRTPVLPLLAVLLPLALMAAAPRHKPRPASAAAPAASSHPPGPPPVAAGSGGSGVVVAFSLRVGGQPLKGLGARLYFLHPGDPQPLSVTFVSGSGPATKIISLDYRIMKAKPAAPAAPLEIELIPPGEKSGRKITLFADGRSRVVSIWRREFPAAAAAPADEEILLELKPASPGESAAVELKTPRTVGRSFRIRAQLIQALSTGDKSLENSEFIAPLGDSAHAEYDNLTVRVETRTAPEVAPAASAPASAPVVPAPPAVRTVGDSGLFIQPPAAQLPVPAPAAVAPGAPVGGVTSGPANTQTVEDHDHLLLKISAETADNHRLRYSVLIEGTLAPLLGDPVPLYLSREFTGYRHEPAFLIISAPGARYQYSLSLDPDWQEEDPASAPLGGK